MDTQLYVRQSRILFILNCKLPLLLYWQYLYRYCSLHLRHVFGRCLSNGLLQCEGQLHSGDDLKMLPQALRQARKVHTLRDGHPRLPQQRERALLLLADPGPPPVLPLPGGAVEVNAQRWPLCLLATLCMQRWLWSAPAPQAGDDTRVGHVCPASVQPTVLCVRFAVLQKADQSCVADIYQTVGMVGGTWPHTASHPHAPTLFHTLSRTR